MADPVSISGSIFAVLQLSKVVVGYIKDVHGGSDDRVRLRDSIWSTISLLEMLNARFEDAESEGEDLKYKLNVQAPLRELNWTLEVLVAKLAPAGGLRKAMQKLAWPFDKKEINELLTSIENQKTFFGLALQNDHMRLTQSLKNDLKEVNQGVETLKMNQHQRLQQLRGALEKEAIDWISPIRFVEKQLDIEDERVPGTSEWVLSHSLFKSWATGNGSRNLWCPGIPGAGKTVIASVIINHLLNLQKSSPGLKIGVAFVYCNYKEQEQQTLPNLLSSILHQLTLSTSDISQTLMDGLKDYHKRRVRPPSAWVVKAIADIISGRGPVYLVVDALDECTESDGKRSDLMAALSKMPDNLRILCTSRELPDIEQLFLDADQIRIHAQDYDIERYLTERIEQTARLKKHCKADPNLLRAIINTVVDRVDGMFLLAQLHIEILSKKQDRKSVRRALETLPTSLDDTYNQAMQRIQSQDADDAELAQRVLFWISFAVTPLSIREVRCAIAAGNLEADEQDLDDDSYVDEEVLIDVCAGIVATDKSHAIRLVHYTAQEYFERNRGKMFPQAQSHITRTCLRYLSLKAFASPLPEWKEMSERQVTYPLLNYASTYWGYHAVESPEQEVIENIFDFLKLVSHLQTSVQCLPGTPSYIKMMSLNGKDLGLWVASRFGLMITSQRLIRDGADVNVRLPIWTGSSTKYSALRNCVVSGFTEIAAMLLDNGATVSDSDQKESLVALAAYHGHAPILKMFFARGFDIHAKDEIHGNALSAAISGRSTESCRFLIEAGASLQYWVAPHGNPLGQAIAQLRIAPDAEGHSSSEAGGRKRTKIEKAKSIENDGMAIVRLLLEVGADVEGKNSYGEPLILVAALLSYQQVVRLLLDNGASPNTTDWLGRNLLHFWVDDKISQLFIDTKTDVNCASKSGETPLHFAASLGQVGLVRLLLDNGGEINTTSRAGYTPMDKALMHGQETLELEQLGAVTGSSPLSSKVLSQLHVPTTSSNMKSKRLKSRVVLQDLKGEAWNAEFSSDGKLLATYGDSGVLNIYQTEDFVLLKTLSDGPSPLSDLCWSLDNTKVVTGSTDQHTRLWDVVNGVLLAKTPAFGTAVYDCLWFPDQEQFITCCMDAKLALCLWSIDGTLVHDFDVGQRIMGCAIAPGTGNIVAFARDTIFVYDHKTFELLVTKDIHVYNFIVQGVCASPGIPYALLQIKSRLVLVCLETLEIVEIFQQDDEAQFVIKSHLGGAEDHKYVTCGSGTGHIYIWDWTTRRLISKTIARGPFQEGIDRNVRDRMTRLHAYTNDPPACCNSVTWHPTIPNMLVSASDDGAVIVWELVDDDTEQEELTEEELTPSSFNINALVSNT